MTSDSLILSIEILNCSFKVLTKVTTEKKQKNPINHKIIDKEYISILKNNKPNVNNASVKIIKIIVNAKLYLVLLS